MNNNKPDFNNLEIAFSSKSDRDLKRANRIFTLIGNPTLSKLGTSLAKLGLALRLPITGIIRKTTFNHFCGGISIEDCHGTIEELNKFGIGTILDYSVEGGETEEGFEAAKEEILHVINVAANSEAIPFSVFKMTGMASTALLEKVGSGKELTNDESLAFERIKSRVEEVCQAAYDVGLPIMIDAEETWIQGPIDNICLEMMKKYNRQKSIVYNTYQMYTVDSLDRLKAHHADLREIGIKMGAKLVRGAYMEKERDRAEEMGYPSPIHPNKKSTDECFDAGIMYCAENYQDISVMCGSHNEQSNLLLTDLMREMNFEPSNDHFWFAQLYGMSDNISFNLAKEGFNVTKYVPYGPVRAVMPYLFRRAAENTSVEGQSSRELQMIRKELNRRKES